MTGFFSRLFSREWERKRPCANCSHDRSEHLHGEMWVLGHCGVCSCRSFREPSEGRTDA